MKISLNWLNDYIDIKDISIETIVDKLTYAGLEVENVEIQSKVFENICVGLVKEVKKHPNATKLSLCIVTDGKDDFNVVCGAPNVAKDQKVPFAKVGAVIPSNKLVLEKAKIRGEYSFGMICSAFELGINDDSDGILVLDNSLQVGSSFSDAMGLNDVVFEIAITPNRADALSHAGIARDIAAIMNRELKLPKLDFNDSNIKSSDVTKIEIADEINCPRYIGKVVKDVQIKESPEWLKNRLKSIGLRPINNVVDVTNFVLYEIGQPLHAFDLDNLSGKKIIVRCASEHEKFTTLDSKEREMSSTDLMICDGEKPVAIAGVMGGENSEVTSETKNILIESAYFNPSSIRRTSKKLGLSTDASYRFERGTDYEVTNWAARRAAQLIQQTAGGEILSGEIDVYPNKFILNKCTLRYNRIEKVLGYDVPNESVKNILLKLGFHILGENEAQLDLQIPSFRNDIEREIDIIEEVARIYGFEKIPNVHKISVTLEEKVDQSFYCDNLRLIMTSLGFYEIITNSLLSESTAERFGTPIKLLNPLSSEMSHLRPSLLPGMLQSISNNIKVSEKNLLFFEIGKIFERRNELINSFDDFTESENLIFAITGNEIESEWFSIDITRSFYDLKGYVQSILEKLYPDIIFEFSYQNKIKDYEYDFVVKFNSKILGFGGMVKSEICRLYDINQDVFAFEYNIDVLKQIEAKSKSFKELLKFPKVNRDFAFILDNEIETDKVIEVIKEASSNLLHQIKLFDIFQSDSLGKDKKSLAFQLEYYDEMRTLKEEEVEKDFRNAIKAVEKTFNAQLRGI